MFEHMFEHGGVTRSLGSTALNDLQIVRASALCPPSGPSAGSPAHLTARAATLSTDYHPVLPGLRDLLSAPGLRRGSTYCVSSSTSLCLALLAGSTQADRWVAVVGIPTLGAQAAAGLGIDLEHLALVPDPGRQWLDVVATLADAVDVIVAAPPALPRPSDVHRLAARLRQRGTTLIVHGQSWPGSEQRLTVSDSAWVGLRPDGLGCLSARHALVTAVGKGAPSTMRMWLPGPDGSVRPYHAEVDGQTYRRASTTGPALDPAPALRAVR